MSRKPRLIATAIALPVALAAGLALASAVVLLMLQQNLDQFRWTGFLGYWQQVANPEWAAFASKIKASAAIGFGLPLLGWLVLLLKSIQAPERALHGDAKFASKSDLAAKGLLKDHDQGVVVGQIGGERIRLAGQQFVILAAPTRSGKGVGVVIPNLLDYRDSMVVLDIKQENFDLTSGWRKSIGHEVFLFNPFAEDRRTHRWNPLSYVSSDPAFRVSDLQSIAAMLYPDGDERNKFWTSQARNAFLALALYLFERHDRQVADGVAVMLRKSPTLGRLYRLSSGDGSSELKTHLKQLADADFLGSAGKNAFATLLSQAPETFASIMGSFKEPLNAWINPVLDAATSADDFLLTDVRKKRMTIYVGIQPNKLAESRLIVSLFFSQLINVNTKTLPQNDPALKHQCLLLMDEFTAIGKVDIIATAVSYMAGYNLRLLPIIQSLAQLDAVYGKELSRTIITNHALQIVFTPREQQDAQDYSEMLGTTTDKRKTVTRSTSNSVSEAIERRALMLPQELKAMPNDREIVFYEGIPNPVMAEKIRYYEDRTYKARLLPKIEVAALKL
jgi:type IV secretion system protein VirD4